MKTKTWIIVGAAVVVGIGLYMWNKNRNKPLKVAAPVDATIETQQPVQ